MLRSQTARRWTRNSSAENSAADVKGRGLATHKTENIKAKHYGGEVSPEYRVLPRFKSAPGDSEKRSEKTRSSELSSKKVKVRSLSTDDDVIVNHAEFRPTATVTAREKNIQGVKMRTGTEGMKVERTRKAFSWVENRVQELSIKPGVLEMERGGGGGARGGGGGGARGGGEGGGAGYTLQECQRNPSEVRTIPKRYSAGSKWISPQRLSSKEIEDFENEVLWEKYGFKIGRESHDDKVLDGKKDEQQQQQQQQQRQQQQQQQQQLRENIQQQQATGGRNNRGTEEFRNTSQLPRDLSSKSTDVHDSRKTSASREEELKPKLMPHGTSATPQDRSSAVTHGKFQQTLKSESSLGLQESKSGGENKRHSETNTLCLKTNMRTVRCENPLLKQTKSDPVNSRTTHPSTTHHPSSLVNPPPGGAVVTSLQHRSDAAWKSFENMNNPKLTYNREPLDPIYSIPVKVKPVDDSQTLKVNACPGGGGTSNNSQSTKITQGDKCPPPPPSTQLLCSDSAMNAQQKTKPILNTNSQKKSYNATVSLRRKSRNGEDEDSRFSALIVVDIDLENGTGDSGEGFRRIDRSVSHFEGNQQLRGRTRQKEEPSSRRAEAKSHMTRSRSADSSLAYLFEKMYPVAKTSWKNERVPPPEAVPV